MALIFTVKIPMLRVAFAGVALALVATREARAADWPIVQGTERPDAPAVRPFGVVQGMVEGIVAEPVTGLGPRLARFENRRSAPNSVSTTDETSFGFAVRRARAGLRGAMPGTEGRLSYYVLGELGNVPIARDGPTLADAWVTIGYIPGARIRVGQFRLPLMDEGVESNALAAEWISLSAPASALVLENPVKNGRYDGGAYGFRDVGIEVFDTYRRGHLALAYAVALTNGRTAGLDRDDAKDVTARTTASWVFSGRDDDPHRQELSLFVWGQRGERDLDGLSVQRIRSGAGLLLEKEPLRVRAEIVYASGAIFNGPSPSFVGEPISVAPRARALGGYVQARVRVERHTTIGLRFDALDRAPDDAKAERVSRALAPMAEYDITPRIRLQAMYEKRWLFAPGADADTKRIASTIGDRLAAQVTVAF